MSYAMKASNHEQSLEHLLSLLPDNLLDSTNRSHPIDNNPDQSVDSTSTQQNEGVDIPVPTAKIGFPNTGQRPDNSIQQRRMSLALAAAISQHELHMGQAGSSSSLPSSASTESLAFADNIEATSSTDSPMVLSEEDFHPSFFGIQSSSGNKRSQLPSADSTVSIPSPAAQFASVHPSSALSFLSESAPDNSSPLNDYQFRDRSNSVHSVAMLLAQGLRPKSAPPMGSSLLDSNPSATAHSSASDSSSDTSSSFEPSTSTSSRPKALLQTGRQSPVQQDSSKTSGLPSPMKRQRTSSRAVSQSPLQQQPRSSSTGSSTGSKLYPCTFPNCGKVFPRAYNLKSHSFCHSGERPHRCLWCTATFSRKHDLQRHTRTLHAKEKQHSCGICSQAFPSLEVLNSHISEAHSISGSNTSNRHSIRLCQTSGKSMPTTPTQSSDTNTNTLLVAAAADWESTYCAKQEAPSSSSLQRIEGCDPVQGVESEQCPEAFHESDDAVGGFEIPDALLSLALKHRRASGTAGGSIGVLALAAEAEMKRQQELRSRGQNAASDLVGLDKMETKADVEYVSL